MGPGLKQTICLICQGNKEAGGYADLAKKHSHHGNFTCCIREVMGAGPEQASWDFHGIGDNLVPVRPAAAVTAAAAAQIEINRQHKFTLLLCWRNLRWF